MYNLTKTEFDRELEGCTSICAVLVHNYRKWWQATFYLYALIRLVLRTNYNHSAVILYRYGAPHLVIQAIGLGVVAHYYDDWVKAEKRDILLLPLSMIDYQSTQYAFGKPYDYLKYLRAILEILKVKGVADHELPRPPFYCFELTQYLTKREYGPHSPKSILLSYGLKPE